MIMWFASTALRLLSNAKARQSVREVLAAMHPASLEKNKMK